MSDEYKFTQDWFHWAPEVWERLIPLLPERKRFLELGSFEGRSTIWTVENMMEDGGEIVCVDTWEGGEEHKVDGDQNFDVVADNFNNNMYVLERKYPDRRVNKVVSTTYEALRFSKGDFDFIYIDASHKAKDVLTDACMAWPLLKNGGVMVFDDYLWGDPRDALHRPKLAVDAFINLFSEGLTVVHLGLQAAVKKIEKVVT